MKITKDVEKFALILISASFAPYPIAARSDEPSPEYEIITIVPEEIVAPENAVAREPVVIEISGVFRDSCYHLQSAEAQVNQEDQSILVHSTAKHFSKAICLFVLTPFHDRISLGPLNAGIYSIYVRNESGGADLSPVQIRVQPDSP